MSEQNFENRMVKLFKSLGFLVVNCTSSRPFDIVAIKDNVPYIIELKGKDTEYPKKQRVGQTYLCLETGNIFFVIRQSKKIRGRFTVRMFPEFRLDMKAQFGLKFLKKILWKWREDRES